MPMSGDRAAFALDALLAAETSFSSQVAWEKFLEQYSPLILHAIRRTTREHDLVMDRYAFVLEALSRDEYRRLRAFRLHGRGSFTTWLVAVVRRLCVDEYRARYGRPQSDTADWQSERRNLTDLVGDELALHGVASDGDDPVDALITSEQRGILDASLARLSAADRLLLRLRFEDDVSVPEIARLIHEPSPFRLYRRIDKLLHALRSELRARGIRDLAR